MYRMHLILSIGILNIAASTFVPLYDFHSNSLSFKDNLGQTAGASPVSITSQEAVLVDTTARGLFVLLCQPVQQLAKPLQDVATMQGHRHLTPPILRPSTNASYISSKSILNTSLSLASQTLPTRWAIYQNTKDFATTINPASFGHKQNSFVSSPQSPKRLVTKPLSNMGRFKDLTGQKFGRLTVLSRAENYIRPSGKTLSQWNSICECGKSAIVKGTYLICGNTKSCGCLIHDVLIERNTTHNLSWKTPLYYIWMGIKSRCENPKNEAYHNYGGRGIILSERWQDFQNFYNDMLPTYFKGGTVERLDVNGNYCPANCEWMARPEQAKNRRNRICITYNGEQRYLKDVCDELKLPYEPIRSRITKHGWEVSKALNTPIQKWSPYGDPLKRSSLPRV